MKKIANIKCAFIFILYGVLIMNCNTTDKSNNNKNPMTPSQTYELKTDEILLLEKDALLGSGDAAFKLFQYYEFVERDIKNSLYWLTISAENGDYRGQYNLAYTLMLDSNVHSLLRAKYWIIKVVNIGNKDAVELLEEINDKLEKMKDKEAKNKTK